LAQRQDVTVVKASQSVLLAQIDNESFFRRLARKLSWGDLEGRAI
jgi:hypothetical protein